MWTPWGMPDLAAQIVMACATGMFAWVLARLAWILPRAIDSDLPTLATRRHQLCRRLLLLGGPVAGIVAAALFGQTPAALAAGLFIVTLLTLGWIDGETGLLPDALTLPLLWAGLLLNLRVGYVPLEDAVLGAVAGYGVLWVVFWLFLLLTQREGMGRGDFKLLAAQGAWLGWAALPWILLVSSGLALIVAVILRATGRLQPGAPMSFGPYLAFGGVAVMLGFYGGLPR